MEYIERRITMGEQVGLMVAIDAEIKSESELVSQLRQAGLHNLTKPRESSIIQLQELHSVISQCVKLVALVPVDMRETSTMEREDVWNRPNDEYGQDGPPF